MSVSTSPFPAPHVGEAVEYFPATRQGSPFSRTVRVGDIIYLSGQIGTDPDGRLADGLAAQTHQTMQNIAADLDTIGSSLDAVFTCTIMLADMTRWKEFNAVYLSYFDPERLPARSAFGTSALVAGALMEITCCARVSTAHSPNGARA